MQGTSVIVHSAGHYEISQDCIGTEGVVPRNMGINEGLLLVLSFKGLIITLNSHLFNEKGSKFWGYLVGTISQGVIIRHFVHQA
jgi:hypothetical protein